jgi:hypothetical protein
MSLVISSGVIGMGTPSSSAHLARSAGSRRILVNAALSLLTTASGVPAGAARLDQMWIVRSG